MGFFDKIRQVFRGIPSSGQPEQPPETAAAPEMTEVSLSPLPKSNSRMPKGQHIDRLGMMHAADIGFGPSFGPEQPGFWEYKEQKPKGYSKEDYLEMASHVPEVRERLNNGESLESLLEDKRVGDCAKYYFSPEEMIRIESHPDGRYEYSNGGRHRIAAAQELGIEIPVQINEYGRKSDYPIKAWEKQERYDALMDYMTEHGYSEVDRAVYEADPEWQRLHSEFDHPVWDKPELSDWEREADALLEKQYREARTKPAPSAAAQSASSGDRYQSSYADRKRWTPSVKSNRWAGERGESVCAPRSDAARKILEEKGISGVQYQNGIPDFSPFSESTVKLGYMTDARHNQDLAAGQDGKNTIYAHFKDGKTVSVSHYADKNSLADLNMKYGKPGNFEQADALTAEQWTADGREGKEWTAEDVAQYRQEHGLTWHECNDMETMQMIPEAINADFGHLGGVGEVKETQRVIDEALRDYDEGEMVEAEEYDEMSSEELEALEREHGHYDEDGVWIPDKRSAEPAEEADQDTPDEQNEEDINLDDDQGYLKVEHDEETGSQADGIAVQTDEDGLPENSATDEAASEDIQDIVPDISEDGGVSEEQAVDRLENTASEENVDQFEQTIQDQQENIPDASGEDTEVNEPLIQESSIQETDEQAMQESVDQETEEEAVQETLEQETEEQIAQEADDLEAEEQIVQEPVDEEAEEEAVQEILDEKVEEEAVQEALEQETEEQIAQEADDLEAEEQIVQEPVDEEAEEEAVQEILDEEVEEEAEQETLEQETEEQAAQETADQETDGQVMQEPIDEEAEEEAVQEILDEEVEEKAEQETLEQETEEQIAQEADDLGTEEQVVQETIDEEVEEQTEQETLEQETEEQIAQEVDDLEAEEQVVQETIDEEAEEAVQEILDEEDEEEAEQETLEQETEEQIAQEADDLEAEEQIVQELVDEEVEEEAEQETLEQETEEQIAQEVDDLEAEEQVVQETIDGEAEEEAVQEILDEEVEEEAEQETLGQKTEEQIAQEVDDLETDEQISPEDAGWNDEFADEQSEEYFTDADEDYSDLADEPVEESPDNPDCSALADETAEGYIDEPADYSDLTDNIDSDPYDDASFDSFDTTFESDDTYLDDDGGDILE